jgi:cyclophilin family peptidyl-prolyl cis-trans isomerase
MRLKLFVALLAGIIMAGPLAAQRIAMPPPPPPMDSENTLYLDLSTGGRVTIQLRPDVAPLHVARVKELVRKGFYNGMVFHRVIDGFMAQTGDPNGNGTGGSDLPDLTAEFNGLPHVRGALGMARTEEPNTANSQFYIMFVPRLAMDGKYTVFGRVMAGMNYVDTLNRGEPPAQPGWIVKASIGADNVAPPTPAELAAPPRPVLPVVPVVRVAPPPAATSTPAEVPVPAPSTDTPVPDAAARGCGPRRTATGGRVEPQLKPLCLRGRVQGQGVRRPGSIPVPRAPRCKGLEPPQCA